MININSSNLNNKKILLIDDEKDILNLLETVLIKEGFKEIYKAENGNKGIELCEKVNPDIIVLDIMLPDIDGYEVCKRIREFSMCPIIFLSAKSDDVDKLLGLGIGGDDYVTKPFSPKEIAFRIKAHFRRLEHMQLIGNEKKSDDNKEVFKFKDIEIDENKAEVKKSGEVLNLTAKEYQLLLHLVKNSNMILSKNSLIENIWGSEYEGYDNTLMVHIRHLREKLEDDPSKPQHILTFKGLGYKFVMGD